MVYRYHCNKCDADHVDPNHHGAFVGGPPQESNEWIHMTPEEAAAEMHRRFAIYKKGQVERQIAKIKEKLAENVAAYKAEHGKKPRQ